MKKRNILFIENSIGLSGSTISLCTLLSQLDRKAYEPWVILSRVEQQNYLNGYPDLSFHTTVIRCRDNLTRTPIVATIIAIAAAFDPCMKRFALRVLAVLDLLFRVGPYLLKMYIFARDKHIDLVHHNNGFDVAGILLSRLLRKPIVAYQRGDEWNSFLVRHLAQFVDVYIANSKATQQSLLSIGVRPERVAVIYPPVDFSRFNYRLYSNTKDEFGLSNDQRSFGIMGTILEWKGHRVFLKAARKVLGAVPNSTAFIIGDVPDGNEQYRQELILLARELGIEQRVIFTGFRSDIPELIQMLDVVVHTSIQPEPFGRVIVEAMAMKKPVVASQAGGPTEIITDGYCGFLTPPGDDEKLADKIIQLLGDRELAIRIGHQAHLEAKSKFSISKHTQMMHEIYSRFLLL